MFAATPVSIVGAVHWIGIGMQSNGAGAAGLRSPIIVRPTRPLDPVQEVDEMALNNTTASNAASDDERTS